jgi:hypothetical protein
MAAALGAIVAARHAVARGAAIPASAPSRQQGACCHPCLCHPSSPVFVLDDAFRDYGGCLLPLPHGHCPVRRHPTHIPGCGLSSSCRHPSILPGPVVGLLLLPTLPWTVSSGCSAMVQSVCRESPECCRPGQGDSSSRHSELDMPPPRAPTLVLWWMPWCPAAALASWLPPWAPPSWPPRRRPDPLAATLASCRRQSPLPPPWPTSQVPLLSLPTGHRPRPLADALALLLPVALAPPLEVVALDLRLTPWAPPRRSLSR